jgi:FtsH-binding integral membrane protein
MSGVFLVYLLNGTSMCVFFLLLSFGKMTVANAINKRHFSHMVKFLVSVNKVYNVLVLAPVGNLLRADKR